MRKKHMQKIGVKRPYLLIMLFMNFIMQYTMKRFTQFSVGVTIDATGAVTDVAAAAAAA